MSLSNFIYLQNGELATATTTYTTGVSEGARGRGYECIQGPWTNFYATLVATYTNGTSLDVSIEHSGDGSNWISIGSFAQVTTASSTQGLSLTGSSVASLLPFVRAKMVTVGGTVSYVVEIKLWYESLK